MRAIALAVILAGMMIERAIERAIEKKPMSDAEAQTFAVGAILFLICLIGGW